MTNDLGGKLLVLLRVKEVLNVFSRFVHRTNIVEVPHV